jgi:membrane protein YdbS with pleckstrin-like domain
LWTATHLSCHRSQLVNPDLIVQCFASGPAANIITASRHAVSLGYLGTACSIGTAKRKKLRKGMSYVDKNLLPQEQVVYKAHLHWIVYGPAAVLILFAIVSFIVGAANSASAVGEAIGGFILLIGLYSLLVQWIRMKTSEFAVTTKRVVIKVGLIRRHSLELLLRQVEGIRVDQGIIGRMLGYGTIVVGGTGGTAEPFPAISGPLEFRRQVQMQSST